jgi:hypothetical protein
MTVVISPSSSNSISPPISRTRPFSELNFMKTVVNGSITLTLSTSRRWERKWRPKIACMRSRNFARNNRDRNIYPTLVGWRGREIRVPIRAKTLNATRLTCKTSSGKLWWWGWESHQTRSLYLTWVHWGSIVTVIRTTIDQYYIYRL